MQAPPQAKSGWSRGPVWRSVTRPGLPVNMRKIAPVWHSTMGAGTRTVSPGGCKVRLQRGMPDWLILILLPAGYFAVMRWVLPKFGVPT
jgi:hypothetical protein